MGVVVDERANGAHDHVPFVGGLPLFPRTSKLGERSIQPLIWKDDVTMEPQTMDPWDGKPRLIFCLQALSAA